MSDFFHPKTEQKARKQYRCIWCCEHVLVGETYFKQVGVFDGAWYVNHWHPECWEDADLDGSDEFMPCSAERPIHG